MPVNKFQFRVRIWRQTGQPPLVLFSQLPGQPPPDFCSVFLANFVLRTFLGYSLPVRAFFELSAYKGQTRACRVRFEVLGAPLRPVLCNPNHTPLVPSAVEQLFKVKLDAPN
jgi:hypothetical protein